LFTWEKLGRIYDPVDFPERPIWMHSHAIAPNTLVLEDRVRVFFGSRKPRDDAGQVESYLGYLDLRRENLFDIIGVAKDPVLSLGGKGTFDEFGTYPMSVVQHESSVIGVYAGWTRSVSVPFNVGLGIAISRNNGDTFFRLAEGPIIPYSPDEPFVLSSPKLRVFHNKFYLFYVAGKKWINVGGKHEICHRIRLATSEDGLHWTRVGNDLIQPRWDPEEAQASPDVFFFDGRYHMFFCGWVPSTFRHTRARKIGYAWSRDLVSWSRDDSRAGIEPSESGWDSEMVAYPHVFELDGEIYLIYNGNDVGRFGFGLARLRQ
jgi:predicted GH43/DUF377 family glycosyl hydrolase